MIKLKILRGVVYPGWALNAITCVLIRGKQREMSLSLTHTHTHTHIPTPTQRRRCCEDRAERGLKMLALKIGVMWTQVQKCKHPPEAERVKEQILP